jgi:MinD-like ATPase involved in chromosome partitioning or flagellar assembly
MSVIAFGSIKASPGVTTTVLALASVWPSDRSLSIVEADPDGGDLAVRVGLHPEPGLTSLAAAGRRSAIAAQGDQHLQRLPGGITALLGPPDAEQAIRALEMIGDRLGLSGLDGRDVLIDCGRLRPQSPAATLVAQADIVVIVARPRLDELQHLQARIDRLSASGAQVRLLLVGDKPYPPDEVTQALAVPILGVLPVDPTAAAILNGLGGRRTRLERSPLLRHALDIVEALATDPAGASHGPREGSVSDQPAPTADHEVREPSVRSGEQPARSGWAAVFTRDSSPTPADAARTDR